MFFGIRDPGSRMGKNPDSGSGINIPDPQHWFSQWSGRGGWSGRAVLSGGQESQN